MLGNKLEWTLFLALSGIAIYFMFHGEGAIEKYTKRQTVVAVSQESIKQLPTLIFCFHLKVNRDYDVFGKDIKIWFQKSSSSFG